MSRFVAIAVMGLIFSGACVSSPPAVRPLSPFPHDSSSGPLGSTLDSAAHAFGVTPLTDLLFEPGVEEIRYWSGGGITAEQSFVRLVRTGNRVDGMLGLYWRPANPYHHPGDITQGAMVRYFHAGTCRSLVDYGNIEACPLRFRHRPDWRAIWDTLIALGVTSLPEQSSIPRPKLLIFDGGAMTVELRTRDGYRRYSFSNPEAYADSQGQRVVRIARVFRRAYEAVPPSDNERRFRGRLDLSLGKSEFTACGSHVLWGIQLASNLAKLPSGADSSAHALYYIEVRGQLAMPGMRWGLPYPEIVQSFEDLVVIPWQAKHC